jgi:hypothetical protein
MRSQEVEIKMDDRIEPAGKVLLKTRCIRGNAWAAAALSFLSTPRITILSAPSRKGRRSALASRRFCIPNAKA